MESSHGKKYIVEGRIETPSGKTPLVRTVWIVDRGETVARLGNSISARGMTMIKEHDRIVLNAALPEEGLEKGDVGTVVHVYRDGQAFEVEL